MRPEGVEPQPSDLKSELYPVELRAHILSFK